MRIRNLLFLVIPLLFLINSAISLLLLSSSHQINESFAKLKERLLVYEHINERVQQNIQLADQWLSTQSTEVFIAMQEGAIQLDTQLNHLISYGPPLQHEAEALSFWALIERYMEIEKQFIEVSVEEALLYAAYVDEAELLSSYIAEESYRMNSLELASFEQRYETIMQEAARLRASGIALLVGVTLLCLWFAYGISKTISEPIHQLVHTAEHISRGDLERPIVQYPKHSDFHVLGAAFQHMQNKLKNVIATEREALEKDKLIKEMELEVLKSQINPHFLFNSLNVMSKLALIEGAERTSDLTVAMANLLRYNLKQLDTPVPLRDEVKHANDYFYIQQARYRDRVQFHTEIDEQQLDTTVPVLTLQPLLENIFVHGIENLEQGAEITLRIQGDDQYTWVTIIDNGIGMNEQTKNQLLLYEQGPLASTAMPESHQSTGLGTRNVFRRLQLLYGEQHQVHINSSPGAGTSITLRIPRHKED